MTKALLAGVAALSLLAAAETAHADECVMAIPPTDKEGACDFGLGAKTPVDQCKEHGHPLYYREKGAPGLLHLRLMPTKKSNWVGKVEYGDILWSYSKDVFIPPKNWAYVYGVTSSSGGERKEYMGWRGYVSTKYIKSIKCPVIDPPKPGDIRPEDLG